MRQVSLLTFLTFLTCLISFTTANVCTQAQLATCRVYLIAPCGQGKVFLPGNSSDSTNCCGKCVDDCRLFVRCPVRESCPSGETLIKATGLPGRCCDQCVNSICSRVRCQQPTGWPKCPRGSTPLAADPVKGRCCNQCCQRRLVKCAAGFQAVDVTDPATGCPLATCKRIPCSSEFCPLVSEKICKAQGKKLSHYNPPPHCCDKCVTTCPVVTQNTCNILGLTLVPADSPVKSCASCEKPIFCTLGLCPNVTVEQCRKQGKFLAHKSPVRCCDECVSL
jgi:hypothetical protein